MGRAGSVYGLFCKLVLLDGGDDLLNIRRKRAVFLETRHACANNLVSATDTASGLKRLTVCEALCGGEQFDAGPGDFVLLPVGLPHAFRVTSEVPLRTLQITVPGGTLADRVDRRRLVLTLLALAVAGLADTFTVLSRASSCSRRPPMHSAGG